MCQRWIPDLERQFRDDAACREELQSLGGQWALDKYDSFVKGSHRCDFWRYVQLHRSGGNYLDIKMALSQPWNQTLAAILEEAATDGAVQRWLERTSGRGQGLAQPTGDVGAQGSAQGTRQGLAQPADGVGSQSLAQAPPATVDQPLAVGAQGLAQPERQGLAQPSAEQTLPHGLDGSQGVAQMEQQGLAQPAADRPPQDGLPGLAQGTGQGLAQPATMADAPSLVTDRPPQDGLPGLAQGTGQGLAQPATMADAPFLVMSIGRAKDHIYQGNIWNASPSHPLLTHAIQKVLASSQPQLKKQYLLFCKQLWDALRDDMGREPSPGWNISATWGPIYLFQETWTPGYGPKGDLWYDDSGAGMIIDGHFMRRRTGMYAATRAWNWDHGWKDTKKQVLQAEQAFQAALGGGVQARLTKTERVQACETKEKRFFGKSIQVNVATSCVRRGS